MDPRAIVKAKSRLRSARAAYDSLTSIAPGDLTAFADTWFQFLMAFKGVYTIFEQGVKTSPQSRQWFGARQAERKSDPLVQYVYQARNDDEHGLEPILELTPDEISLLPPKDGESRRINIFADKNEIIISSLDGMPVPNFRYKPAGIKLVWVTGLGNVSFDPPKTHLGNPIPDELPITVAQLALVYLEWLVSEAERLA